MQFNLFVPQEIVPTNSDGWFFWDPWVSFTKETLKLYSDILGDDQFELFDYEEVAVDTYVCKFLISPIGMDRLEKWSSKRKSLNAF